MGAIDTVIAKNTNEKLSVDTEGRYPQGHSRGHETPRLSMLLRQHERHEVDLAESTFTEYTVVSHSVILLVITTEIGDESGLSQKNTARRTQSA